MKDAAISLLTCAMLEAHHALAAVLSTAGFLRGLQGDGFFPKQAEKVFHLFI